MEIFQLLVVCTFTSSNVLFREVGESEVTTHPARELRWGLSDMLLNDCTEYGSAGELMAAPSGEILITALRCGMDRVHMQVANSHGSDRRLCDSLGNSKHGVRKPSTKFSTAQELAVAADASCLLTRWQHFSA